jgi:hypothetical protein
VYFRTTSVSEWQAYFRTMSVSEWGRPRAHARGSEVCRLTQDFGNNVGFWSIVCCALLQLMEAFAPHWVEEKKVITDNGSKSLLKKSSDSSSNRPIVFPRQLR